jgi:hypothetical protein
VDGRAPTSRSGSATSLDATINPDFGQVEAVLQW